MQYASILQELGKTKKQLFSLLSQIDSAINALQHSSGFSHSGENNNQEQNKLLTELPQQADVDFREKYRDYSHDLILRIKVAYVLKAENRFLRLREIATIMHRLEPQVEVREFAVNISRIFSAMKKENIVIKVVGAHANRTAFWGLPGWTDENGTIKKKHFYSEW